MKTSIATTAFLLIATATSALAGAALEGAKYAKDARVSLPDARAIALKTYPGTIVGQELEKEQGGSGLRYSFDIRNGKATHEVGVDAKDGKVLENSVEGAHAD
jgi:uncharacterized membrane protein YkoI